MIDYIIVGCGLAGIAFAETALNNGKKIVVFNNKSQNSSRIAGGLYNPVILKRFSEVWHANEQTQLLNSFYTSIENKLGIKLLYEIPLLRKFYSVEEQNNWFTASDKPKLQIFLSDKLITKKLNFIDSPFDYGEVLHSGYLDTNLLVLEYINYLTSINSYAETDFDYTQLFITENGYSYKNLESKKIIFAEGFGMLSNPFFNKLPLDGTKGELIIIKSPKLILEEIVKSSIFIVPLGNDLYKVGATYNWIDKTDKPTEEAKNELIKDLKQLIHCDFEIIEHLAGVRPTVKDRRPLLGVHPNDKNMFLLNGLGTRGVMLAPEMAQMLLNHIENKDELNPYVDIKRFKDFASSFCHNEQTY